MQKIFRSYMCLFFVMAALLILGCGYGFMTVDIRQSMIQNNLDEITQIASRIEYNNQELERLSVLKEGLENNLAKQESSAGAGLEQQLEDLQKMIQERNDVDAVFRYVPVLQGEVLFAADKETGEILSHSRDDFNGQNLYQFQVDEEQLDKYLKGKKITFDDDDTYFCVMKEFNGVLIGMGSDYKLLYRNRTMRMAFSALMMLVVFGAVLYLIDLLLRERVVQGIKILLEEVRRLERGQETSELSLSGGAELNQLARDMYRMARGVSKSTSRLSRAMELTNLKMAAYECYDGSNRILATEQLADILGIDKREASDLYLNRQEFEKRLELLQQNPEKEEENVFRISSGDGRMIRWLRMIRVHDGDAALGIIMDVTREMRSKRKIRRERDLDALTGLYNRRCFERSVVDLLERGKFEKAAIVMLDLDDFKQINDTYGHEFGDNYLKHIAKFLKKIAGRKIITGRRSGDEFYLFFHHFASVEEMEDKLQKLYLQIEANPIEFPDGSKKPICLSAGMTICEKDDQRTFLQLLDDADHILYQVKRSEKGVYREDL